MTLRDQMAKDAENILLNPDDLGTTGEVHERDGDVKYIDVRLNVNVTDTQPLSDTRGGRNQMGVIVLAAKADYPEPKQGDKIKVPDEEDEDAYWYGVRDWDSSPGLWVLTCRRFGDEEYSQKGARRTS